MIRFFVVEVHDLFLTVIAVELFANVAASYYIEVAEGTSLYLVCLDSPVILLDVVSDVASKVSSFAVLIGLQQSFCFQVFCLLSL